MHDQNGKRRELNNLKETAREKAQTMIHKRIFLEITSLRLSHGETIMWFVGRGGYDKSSVGALGL